MRFGFFLSAGLFFGGFGFSGGSEFGLSGRFCFGSGYCFFCGSEFFFRSDLCFGFFGSCCFFGGGAAGFLSSFGFSCGKRPFFFHRHFAGVFRDLSVCLDFLFLGGENQCLFCSFRVIGRLRFIGFFWSGLGN